MSCQIIIEKMGVDIITFLEIMVDLGTVKDLVTLIKMGSQEPYVTGPFSTSVKIVPNFSNFVTYISLNSTPRVITSKWHSIVQQDTDSISTKPTCTSYLLLQPARSTSQHWQVPRYISLVILSRSRLRRRRRRRRRRRQKGIYFWRRFIDGRCPKNANQSQHFFHSFQSTTTTEVG